MKKLLSHQVLTYLIFGVLTTLVYFLIRGVSVQLGLKTWFAALLANGGAIIFAFVSNDTYVFHQPRQGWQGRLFNFFMARLGTLGLDVLLAYVFVERYPQFIGQWVNHDLLKVDKIESLCSQVLIIVLNYVISKFFVFKG